MAPTPTQETPVIALDTRLDRLAKAFIAADAKPNDENMGVFLAETEAFLEDAKKVRGQAGEEIIKPVIEELVSFFAAQAAARELGAPSELNRRFLQVWSVLTEQYAGRVSGLRKNDEVYSVVRQIMVAQIAMDDLPAVAKTVQNFAHYDYGKTNEFLVTTLIPAQIMAGDLNSAGNFFQWVYENSPGQREHLEKLELGQFIPAQIRAGDLDWAQERLGLILRGYYRTYTTEKRSAAAGIVFDQLVPAYFEAGNLSAVRSCLNILSESSISSQAQKLAAAIFGLETVVPASIKVGDFASAINYINYIVRLNSKSEILREKALDILTQQIIPELIEKKDMGLLSMAAGHVLSYGGAAKASEYSKIVLNVIVPAQLEGGETEDAQTTLENFVNNENIPRSHKAAAFKMMCADIATTHLKEGELQSAGEVLTSIVANPDAGKTMQAAALTDLLEKVIPKMLKALKAGDGSAGYISPYPIYLVLENVLNHGTKAQVENAGEILVGQLAPAMADDDGSGINDIAEMLEDVINHGRVRNKDLKSSALKAYVSHVIEPMLLQRQYGFPADEMVAAGEFVLKHGNDEVKQTFAGALEKAISDPAFDGRYGTEELETLLHLAKSPKMKTCKGIDKISARLQAQMDRLNPPKVTEPEPKSAAASSVPQPEPRPAQEVPPHVLGMAVGQFLLQVRRTR